MTHATSQHFRRTTLGATAAVEALEGRKLLSFAALDLSFPTTASCPAWSGQRTPFRKAIC